MIKEILIRDFRNIRHLDFKTKPFNIIQGPEASGKSSVLDAIALTDFSDDQFFAILKNSFYEPHRQMELRELVQLNFFSHQKEQESVKVKLRFYQRPTRKLEVWRTDDAQSTGSGMAKAVVSPYIFVYESSDLTKIQPRAIQYTKVDKNFREIKSTIDKWPTNYIGPDRVFSLPLLTKRYKALRNSPYFKAVLLSMVENFEELDAIGVFPYGKSDTIMVKLNDREQLVPLYGCPQRLFRCLTILTLLASTQKQYVLIDDLERGLNDKDLGWLISQITYLALAGGIQIFATTNNERVSSMFDKVLRNKDQHYRSLDLGRVKTSVSNKEVAVV